jgi:hypothetical protein
MDDHSKNLLVEPDKRIRNLLSQSSIESDRKFWFGERPISALQWIGLLLMFLAMAGWRLFPATAPVLPNWWSSL